MLVCDQCGETFFFTVTEQRRMAEELGHQEFEAPHLCPRCRQLQAEPLAASETPSEAEFVEHEPEPMEAVAEPVADLEPVSEPEYAPEPERKPEREPEQVPQPEPGPPSKVLAGIDDSLLEDVGVRVKLIGRVKWFSRKKGYGFVTKADGEEVFFHRSDVLAADMHELKDGVQVEFDVRRTDKGLEAFDVSILPAA
jgi:CspA family cold shock protein